jgi:choline dehydrogenase-like flavoprotein
MQLIETALILTGWNRGPISFIEDCLYKITSAENQSGAASGWSFEQVLPYFKRAETNARGANDWHGDSGPIVVKPSQLDLPICDAFLRSCGVHAVQGLCRR